MRGRLNTRWVAALLCLLVVGLLYFQIHDAARSAGRRIGFDSQPEQGGIRVGVVQTNMAGERAGLQRGDLLVAVDGQRLENQDDYDFVASGFERDRIAKFDVLRAGHRLELAVLPGAPFPWRDIATNLLVCLGYFVLSLLALPLAMTDARARLLFLFAFAVTVELAIPGNPIGNPTLKMAVDVFMYALTGAQIGLELHLASVIPAPPQWLERRRFIIPGFYFCGLVLSVFLIFSYFLELRTPNPWPWRSLTAFNLLNNGILPVWAASVVGLLLHNAIREPTPRGRQQAALVLLGVLPWFLYVAAGLIFTLRAVELPIWISNLQPWALLTYPVAVFVAIFRYRLFNLEAVVRRTLVYTLLTGLLVLVFYTTVGAGGVLFSEWLDAGRGSVWVVSAATLLLGLLFAPLRRMLQRMIERRFFPERHALRQRLISLAEELPALGQVPRMGRHLAQRLAEIFELKSASVLLADPKSGLLVSVATGGEARVSDGELSLLLSPEDPGMDLLRVSRRALPVAQLAKKSAALAQRMNAARAVLAVPLLSHHRLVGVLLLGERKTSAGRDVPADELELLDLVAKHAATVFENARLFESATYEELTGLLRREAILEVLDKELHRALRYQRPLTLGMADLDHFKRVNDTHGHLAGDTLLKRVSLALVSGLRGTDSIGRFGGEEFLIVLPETQLEGATAVAEKVRGLVESTSTSMEDGAEVRLTVSIGLATLSDVEGPITAATLLAVADRALYRAKNAGRNRVESALAV
ncbi:MAG: diguanylate cyclase [Acidobacteriota bacterium]